MYHPVNIDLIEYFIRKQKPHTVGPDGISGKMLQLCVTWMSAPLLIRP